MLIQDQAQTQQQRIDPKIIMANTVLQLSGLELQQAIEQELEENPALELEDDEPCSGCELTPFGCRDCQYRAQQREEVSQDDITFAELEYTFDSAPETEEQEDIIGCIQADLTLHEYLRQQLRNTVSGKVFEIADYLVNYISESGYLVCDLLEVTLELDASDEEIADAVSIIQTLDPPGVGARDLRECMLVQLHYLDEDGCGNSIAEHIVRDCWEEMKHWKLSRIARRLKIKLEQVRQAIDFVQTKLNPYPAGSFRSPWDYKPLDGRTAVRPDVVVHRTPTGYEIEVIANEHLALAVSPYYRQMYKEMRNGRGRKFSEEDKKHIVEYVERADLFIKNLNQRRKTLKNITRCLVEFQQGYLETGSKLFVRPLTRVKIAEQLRIHESTVSRATANKYVQLPNQEVVPFDFFFQSSLSIGDMIAQLVANEDSAHPLSDQEIADILTQRGHTIARRTVVKYREARKILSSRQRRR